MRSLLGLMLLAVPGQWWRGPDAVGSPSGDGKSAPHRAGTSADSVLSCWPLPAADM